MSEAKEDSHARERLQWSLADGRRLKLANLWTGAVSLLDVQFRDDTMEIIAAGEPKTKTRSWSVFTDDSPNHRGRGETAWFFGSLLLFTPLLSIIARAALLRRAAWVKVECSRRRRVSPVPAVGSVPPSASSP